MTPDEIAAEVLEQNPELVDKWLGMRVRFNDSGVTWWLQTRTGR